MQNDTRPQVIIIGAGLGGLSSAITLAAKGYRVEIFEKNDRAGGKLNQLTKGGFRFDLGPSILSMPHIFSELFSLAGKKMEDYIHLVKLHTHWRNFFENGTVIDLVGNYDRQKEIFSHLHPDLPYQFLHFLNYAHNQYRIINRSYFKNGADSFSDVLRNFPPWGFTGLDGLRSMHTALQDHFKDPLIREIFSYFAKYIGSSPFNAPGFLNLLPWIQYAFGLWYIEGGMYNLCSALIRLLKELKIKLHLSTEVTELLCLEKRICGARLADGSTAKGDIFISNMEVRPAYEKLLGAPPKILKKLGRFEPSCSGLVIHLGVDTVYPQLAHHNFLYSRNQKESFQAIFNKHVLPDDPTIYLVAPARTDKTIAPEGCDVIKLLPHVPHLSDKCSFTYEEYDTMKNKLIHKCQRMGLKELREHIVVEDVMTPFDIQDMYYSTGGSIYGVVSDLWKNYGFKAPKQSPLYSNLFFCGGSVNPGGGMPMVILGGMNTGHLVEKMFPLSRLEQT